ncbi:hypothetical protein NL676_035266 [Syzygium grande]|nr:hypothetical protein NL676_035266 [Syzygium grande]
MENLQVSGLTSVDSPRAHIRIQNCTVAKLTTLVIEAPGESPNNDGIAIGASSYIQIHDSTIGTGDDCISIKGGTSFIDITSVKCRPGHGISIGSLGYEGAYDTVEELIVRNCIIKSAQNGVRIKTWEGGSGYVRGGIAGGEGKRCDVSKCEGDFMAPVVDHPNVRGRTGCTNIMLDHINLDSLEPGEKSYAECKNVVNATFTSVDPPISCQTL